MESSFRGIIPLAPPHRPLAITLILGLFGIAAALYFYSLPAIRSTDAKTIPGAKGVQVAYLPGATDQSLAFSEVTTRDSEFVEITNPHVLPVMNKTANSVRWFRININNPDPYERRIVLDLIWRVYDHVTLYQQAETGNWIISLVGTRVSAKDPLLSPRKSAFELTLPPADDSVIYIRAQDYYRLPSQFQIWPCVDDYIHWEIFDYAKAFGYFTLWLGMISTGLFLYAMVGERSQLYFVLFAFCIGALNVISSGTLWLLTPFPGWPLGESLTAMLGALGLFYLCLFARHFLRLPEEDHSLDIIVRVTQWFTLSILISVSAVFFPQYGLAYLQGCFAVGLLVTLVLITASVKRWWAGNTDAPFFLLAFSPYVAAMGIRFSGAQDHYVRDDEARLLALIANALTLIFLSFAAAYRHRTALLEKQKLQLRYQEELSSEVARRTDDLTVLTDRLSHALADRDKVMTIIGHDLRSPAANLYSLTQVITQWPGSMNSDELKKHASRIEQACERQLELLHNLMEWGSGHMQDFSAHATSEISVRENVEKAWHLIEFTGAEKNLQFEAAIDPGLLVKTDQRIFTTVLRNLLANSIKFTPKDGLIRASARGREDGYIEIFVQDSGIGIPKEKLDKLTHALVRSSTGTEGEVGTGIGLKLSYELAVSIGATLELRSELGRGTLATFTIPKAPPSQYSFSVNR